MSPARRGRRTVWGWCFWVLTVGSSLATAVGCKARTEAPSITSETPRSLSAVPSSSSEPLAPVVVFESRPAVVGEKFTTTTVEKTDTHVVGNDGKKIDALENSTTIRVEETLAVSAGVRSKVRLHYLKKTTPAGDQASPVEGKTYLVERRGEALIITTEDGHAPPEAEEKVVHTEESALGKGDKVTLVLGAKPRKVGEPMTDVLAALIDKFSEGKDGVDFDKETAEGRMILTGVDVVDGQRVGHMETEVHFQSKKGQPIQLGTTLTGTNYQSLQGEGVSGGKMSFLMSFSGGVNGTTVATFEETTVLSRD